MKKGKGGNYSGMSQKMPNQGSSKGGGKTAGCTNTGKTGGLRMEAGTNQGATKKPNTKNLFPNGLA